MDDNPTREEVSFKPKEYVKFVDKLCDFLNIIETPRDAKHMLMFHIFLAHDSQESNISLDMFLENCKVAWQIAKDFREGKSDEDLSKGN